MEEQPIEQPQQQQHQQVVAVMDDIINAVAEVGGPGSPTGVTTTLVGGGGGGGVAGGVNGKDGEAKKRTLGEELYLVHLSRWSRKEPNPEDYDFDEPVCHKLLEMRQQKERAMSAGEELWQIHCRRNQGSDEDDDGEDVEEADGKDGNKPPKWCEPVEEVDGEDDEEEEEEGAVAEPPTKKVHVEGEEE